MKRLTNNLISIIMYAIICYIILIPFKIWIIGISISLLFGLLFGFLNEIITQLRILNGENFKDDPKVPKDPENKLSDIPTDAHSLEVFAIKDSEDSPTGKQAFIGFKISNGNFHYIAVPYTEPMN